MDPTDRRDYTDAVPFPERITLTPIGMVRSPYLQRHGTPRQPGMESAREFGTDSAIHLDPAQVAPEALKDLEGFSHLWVISWFHLNGPRKKPLVRPPRGGEKRGVFATRAPHRPVPIGLSAVELLKIEGPVLYVRGLDLIDGTPVLDLKPYIPDYDAFPDASRGWLDP